MLFEREEQNNKIKGDEKKMSEYFSNGWLGVMSQCFMYKIQISVLTTCTLYELWDNGFA